uniref:CSON015051 protein n=1 Tax=Culicoides sonorensis TaxID=179676 RepID=A0A336LNH5_CULSO
MTHIKDACIDPLRRSGVCIGIRSCKHISNILRGKVDTTQRIFLKESQCGWEGTYPKVCCANSVPTVRRPSPGFTNKYFSYEEIE